MLANGATLGYKVGNAGGDYTLLNGLKEIPDMGVDAEKVDNTCLTDTIKHYDIGIGDAGDMTYKFKYENKDAQSAYRIAKAWKPTDVISFEETLSDGTKFQFTAQTSVKLGGGGVNGVLDWELNVALQSDITIVDPI